MLYSPPGRTSIQKLITNSEDHANGHQQRYSAYQGHYQNTRTFSCSYFGDIKYFCSRFALAY
jgi:hypothetical protein